MRINIAHTQLDRRAKQDEILTRVRRDLGRTASRISSLKLKLSTSPKKTTVLSLILGLTRERTCLSKLKRILKFMMRVTRRQLRLKVCSQDSPSMEITFLKVLQTLQRFKLLGKLRIPIRWEVQDLTLIKHSTAVDLTLARRYLEHRPTACRDKL